MKRIARALVFTTALGALYTDVAACSRAYGEDVPGSTTPDATTGGDGSDDAGSYSDAPSDAADAFSGRDASDAGNDAPVDGAPICNPFVTVSCAGDQTGPKCTSATPCCYQSGIFSCTASCTNTAGALRLCCTKSGECPVGYYCRKSSTGTATSCVPGDPAVSPLGTVVCRDNGDCPSMTFCNKPIAPGVNVCDL